MSQSFRVAAVTGAGTGAFTESVLVTPATTASAPLSLTRVGGDQFVTLTWAAPASNGGAAVTSYVVESNDGNSWTESLRTSALEATVAGLTNGTSYLFRVRAVNAAGEGTNATATAVVPSAPAATPTGLTATPGNGQIGLSWSAPGDTGGSAISGYVVERTTDGGATWTTVRTVATAATTFTGLINGASYSFRVRAVNAVGNGAASTFVTATPYTTPGAPRGLVVTPADTQAVLAWAPPSATGGATITSYVVQQSTDNVNWTLVDTPTTNSTTIVDLTNGTQYWFRVYAVNAAVADVNSIETSGAIASTVVSTVPRTTASAPQNLTPTAGDRRVTLGWVAPTDDGGSSLTGYVVQTSSNGGRSWTTAGNVSASTLSFAVTGLTNGVAYAFRVSAVNAAGTGAASTWVTSSPVAPPVAPRSVEVETTTETVASLQWTPPTDDGGAAVVGYKVQTSTDGGITWTDTAQLGPNVFDAGIQTASSDVRVTNTATVSVLGRIRYLAVDDAGLNASTSLQITGLAVGTTYTFRVAAYSLVGQSPWVDTTLQVGTTPSAPNNLAATSTTSSVTLTWDAPSIPVGADLTYKIERSVDGGRIWTVVSTVGATTFVDSGLDAATAYTYRVTPLNVQLVGESVTVEVTTKAAEKQGIIPTPEPEPQPTPEPAPVAAPKISFNVDIADVANIGEATARIAGSFVKAKSKVTVKIEAISGDRAGAPAEVVLVTRANKSGKFAAQLEFADDLPAGRYKLIVQTIGLDGKRVTRTVRFTVDEKQTTAPTTDGTESTDPIEGDGGDTTDDTVTDGETDTVDEPTPTTVPSSQESPDNTDNVTEQPDETVDVTENTTDGTSPVVTFLVTTGGMFFGFVGGWLLRGRRIRRKTPGR